MLRNNPLVRTDGFRIISVLLEAVIVHSIDIVTGFHFNVQLLYNLSRNDWDKRCGMKKDLICF